MTRSSNLRLSSLGHYMSWYCMAHWVWLAARCPFSSSLWARQLSSSTCNSKSLQNAVPQMKSPSHPSRAVTFTVFIIFILFKSSELLFFSLLAEVIFEANSLQRGFHHRIIKKTCFGAGRDKTGTNELCSLERETQIRKGTKRRRKEQNEELDEVEREERPSCNFSRSSREQKRLSLFIVSSVKSKLTVSSSRISSNNKSTSVVRFSVSELQRASKSLATRVPFFDSASKAAFWSARCEASNNKEIGT